MSNKLLFRLAVLVAAMMCALGAIAAEAYACYTSSNTTLTFYYDNQRSSRTGTTYDLNTDENDTGWDTDGTNADVTKVVFDPSFASARPTSTYHWFAEMYDLTSIEGMQYLNTSEVTNMASMFWECGALPAVDVSGFDTRKVTDMSAMFAECYELTALDVTGWNTSHVTDMSWMFSNCSELTSLDVSHFNTSNVTNMRQLFDGCSGLTSLDLSSFNTAKVTDMNSMFYDCSGLTSLDLSSFNTSNVTKMYSMFMYCRSLTSLDLSSFNTAKVTDMNSMFYDCSGLTSLDLSSFNTSNVTSMGYMFYISEALKTIYVSDTWSTAAVTNSYNMFGYCTSLVGGQGTTYDANHTDAAYAHIDDGPSNPGYFTDINSLIEPEAYACKSSDTTLTFYYDKLRSKRPYRTYDLNSDNNYPEWYHDYYSEDITTVVFDPSFAAARPTTTYYWFAELEGLSSISGIEYLNTSDVVNMQGMFFDCSSLTSLDVSHFNTDNVTDMSFMFTECHNLSSLDVSSFNTDSVTTMGGMFFDCFSLTSLDVSNFNTENVTDMSEMFRGCELLTSLDVSSFNTDSVTTMRGMFFDCFSLTSLDVSNFNTENVTDMSEMFNYCYYMETIYVSSGWSTASVTESESMFNYCSNIVGGKGTTYDANHIDKAYAHIDGGTSNPGYFSEKPTFMRGDVNGDNNVSIADVTALIDYLLSGTWN